MTSTDLANPQAALLESAGQVLASGGLSPRTGARVLSTRTACAVVSLMATCGMYDESDRFVQNQQPFIFEQNVEGNGFRLER